MINYLPIKKESNRYAVCGEFVDPLLLAKNFNLSLRKAGIYRTVKQDIIINTGSKSNLEITFQHEFVHALDHLNNKSDSIHDYKFRSSNIFHKLLSKLYDNHMDEKKDTDVFRKLFNSIAVIIGDPILAKRGRETDPSKEIIAHTIPTLSKKWNFETRTQEDRASYFILQQILQDTYSNYIELGLRDPEIKRVFEEKLSLLTFYIKKEKISNDDVDKCVIK
nr:uncharacterized protein LOC124814828 [Hydra vulgaris]